MTDDVSAETYIVCNADGIVSIDPWAGKTRQQLKERCRQLSRAVIHWQRIAMVLSMDGVTALTSHDRDELDKLVQAYAD